MTDSSSNRPLGFQSGQGSGWLGQFKGMPREEVFDRVTGMFLDCGDDEYIAALLSEQMHSAISPQEISQIRFDAAQEADRIGTREALRKWAFRYQYLTTNNLIREYLFISRSTNVMEAKMELADELFWLKKKHTMARLWMAINEALGRNNVPPNVVDDLIEFRETALRIKHLIAKSAKDKNMDPAKLLQEVGPKITEAYQGECRRNRVKAAAIACKLLDVELGTIFPSDVDFFREYSKSAILDDKRVGSGRLSRLVQATDTFQGRRMMNEVLRGNLTLMGSAQIQELVNEMKNNPMLKPEQIHKLIEDIGRERRRHGRKWLKRLKRLLVKYLRLWDARSLFPHLERLEMRIRGVPFPRLQSTVETLNLLASQDEVISYLSTVSEIYPSKPVMRRLSARYFKRRFGVPVPSDQSAIIASQQPAPARQ